MRIPHSGQREGRRGAHMKDTKIYRSCWSDHRAWIMFLDHPLWITSLRSPASDHKAITEWSQSFWMTNTGLWGVNGADYPRLCATIWRRRLKSIRSHPNLAEWRVESFISGKRARHLMVRCLVIKFFGKISGYLSRYPDIIHWILCPVK